VTRKTVLPAEPVTIKPEDLEQLSELSAAASVGPWSVGTGEVYGDAYGEYSNIWHGGYGAPVANFNNRIGARDADKADAAFVVAAVNFVRQLLGERPSKTWQQENPE
jgi:hypothetical protein